MFDGLKHNVVFNSQKLKNLFEIQTRLNRRPPQWDRKEDWRREADDLL